MTDQIIFNQLQQLPDALKQEVIDFIEYLLQKHGMTTATPNGSSKKQPKKSGGNKKPNLAPVEMDEAGAEAFVKKLRRYQVNLPADYRFNRDEANER